MSLSSISSVVGSDVLKGLLVNFPSSTYCFAYGSAVFAQKNQKTGKMVDLIFVVDNPLEWHTENLRNNASHYSFLKYFGPKTILNIEENWACGVYYNTAVRIDNQLIKYGIISTQTVINDLKNWDHAYVAGRLHKPVRGLHPPTNHELVKYLQQNHEYALRTALLLLPQRCTKFDLYYSITELSYIGDSRMIIGENPNKVQNIVSSNISGFDEIYLPLIRKLNPYVTINSDDVVIQDISHNVRLLHLLNLPANLQQHICHQIRGNCYSSTIFTKYENVQEIMEEVSQLSELPNIIRHALGNLIWISSIRQTAAGFLSTGVYGSIKYAFEKLKKAFFPD